MSNTTTKVSYYMTNSQKLDSRPFKEGQIVFVEDAGKIYVDFHGKRTCYTPTSEVIHYSNDCVKFKGSSTTNPMTGIVTINGTSVLHPEKNDLVIFNGGLYLYTTNKWIEFGSGGTALGPVWYNDEDMG